MTPISLTSSVLSARMFQQIDDVNVDKAEKKKKNNEISHPTWRHAVYDRRDGNKIYQTRFASLRSRDAYFAFTMIRHASEARINEI